MSPLPGRSTLTTSAPNQANSCVHVGPDCTCVKSRMRTPSRALDMACGSSICASTRLIIASVILHTLPPHGSKQSRVGSLVHGLVLGAGRVLARVDPDVDDRRAARFGNRLAGAPESGRDLLGITHLLAV